VSAIGGQAVGDVLDLGAGVRLERGISGCAAGFQIQAGEGLVDGPHARRRDAQATDSKTHY
jgi:hypothetical protein